MQARQRHQLLDQAVELSRQMAELGAGGDWQQVIALEGQRRTLLDQAFSETLPADEITAGQIHAILEADKRLMHVGVEARDEAATELTRIQRGRKVKRAYGRAGA